MSQKPPKKPSQEPDQHKPGPHEQRHAIPLPFGEALRRVLKYKPKRTKNKPGEQKQKDD